MPNSKNIFLWLGLLLATLVLLVSTARPVYADGGWIYPIEITSQCYKTGSYHQNYRSIAASSENYHTGVDLGCTASAPSNVPVYASQTGKVVLVQQGWMTYAGWSVFIYHGDDSDGKPIYSFYTHLRSVSVSNDQWIEKGSTLGIMGSTSGGKHVHWGRSNIAPNDFPTYEWHAQDHNGLGWLNPEAMMGGANKAPSIPENSSSNETSQQEQPVTSASPQTPTTYTPKPRTETVNWWLNPLTAAVRINKFSQPITIGIVLMIVAAMGLTLLNKGARGFAGAVVILAIFAGAFLFGIQRVSAQAIFLPPRNTFYSPTVSDQTTSSGYTPKLVSSTPEASSEEQPDKTNTAPQTSGVCSENSKISSAVKQYCGWIEEYANRHGIDPLLIAAVITQESSGNPSAYSKSGAVGLMQVMPRDGIAASFVNDVGVPYFADRPSIAELKDPEFNIKYGCKMLAGLGVVDNPRQALYHYGPDGDDLERVYGDRYYYADLILSIYASFK